MFGIPMVAAGCGLAAALGSVSEVWFSFGDFANSPFFYGTNPRICIGAGDAFFAEDTTILTDTNTGCWDGVMQTSFAGWSAPQIVQFSPASGDSVDSGLAGDSHPLYFGEAAFNYPAFIAWSDGAGMPLMIRGQVYNAVVSSASFARNEPDVFDGSSWISYTDAYFWGTLMVLAGAAAAVGNIAY
jgi:hypothetical protein